MVPKTGLEPVTPKGEDFKSSVYTIPPPGQAKRSFVVTDLVRWKASRILESKSYNL